MVCKHHYSIAILNSFFFFLLGCLGPSLSFIKVYLDQHHILAFEAINICPFYIEIFSLLHISYLTHVGLYKQNMPHTWGRKVNVNSFKN